MALILTLRRGDDFYLNDDRVVVKDVLTPTHAVVTTRDGRAFDVLPDKMVEIAPEVMVGVSDRAPAEEDHTVRVVIRAPQNVLILRGKNYRKGPRHDRFGPAAQAGA